MTLEELKTEVFGKHWQDESWHEVLRLIAGMIDTSFASEIIDYLIEQKGEAKKFSNLFLAAKCLEEVRTCSVLGTTAIQLLNQLKDLTQYDLNYSYEWWAEEARLVREIRTQAVAAVVTSWKDSPDTLPWLKICALSDDHRDVRQAAVKELARSWKDDPETLPWLKTCALSDDHWDVRQTAVQELARNWKDDPETWPTPSVNRSQPCRMRIGLCKKRQCKN